MVARKHCIPLPVQSPCVKDFLHVQTLHTPQPAITLEPEQFWNILALVNRMGIKNAGAIIGNIPCSRMSEVSAPLPVVLHRSHTGFHVRSLRTRQEAQTGHVPAIFVGGASDLVPRAISRRVLNASPCVVGIPIGPSC